jgi:hypothetical protein
MGGFFFSLKQKVKIGAAALWRTSQRKRLVILDTTVQSGSLIS